MSDTYRLIKSRNCYIFRRLVYPRFETLIEPESAPMIKEIRYFEKCSPPELEKVMREVSVHFRQMFIESSCNLSETSLTVEVPAQTDVTIVAESR